MVARSTTNGYSCLSPFTARASQVGMAIYERVLVGKPIDIRHL